MGDGQFDGRRRPGEIAESVICNFGIIAIDETLSSRIRRLFRFLLQITYSVRLQGERHADAVLAPTDIYECSG